jgi:hypothetical protein
LRLRIDYRERLNKRRESGNRKKEKEMRKIQRDAKRGDNFNGCWVGSCGC